MIVSDNPSLIHQSDKTDIRKISDGQWCFTVLENGVLKADFLQINQDLKLDIILAGNNAKCDINCAYLLHNNNHLKIDIHVIHQSGNTTSKQRIKGIATDTASLIFNGIITIPHDSQKCDGEQNHRGLLLSDKAIISATPQLEIWADDVKCSHGSAIGPLNPEQLFYIKTRGLDEHQAKKLLLSSFFGDLMPQEFDSVIQDWMQKHV